MWSVENGSIFKIGEDIFRFVWRCETWQIRMKNPDKTIAIKYIESDEVKESLQVDRVSFSDYLHLERRYLFNCVENLSLFAWFKVIRNKAKEVVLAAIKEIWTIMGAPKILKSDNGWEFMNSLLEQY